MDLRNRLARLDRLTGRPGDGNPESIRRASVEELRSALMTLGLQPLKLPSGTVFVRDSLVAGLAMQADLPDFRGFFSRDAGIEVARGDILFLDTETTGLAGGTGTLAFQVGTAWWEEDSLRIRQYFLSGPADEPALLDSLADLSREFRLVATFNGAAFDLPLLRTRALLNRRPDPLADMGHWDLLVPARRIWGRTLSDCRQQTVEASLVGAPRPDGDIDGSRIPQAWFDFLATGAPGLLGRVLEHNRRDMAGMARILGSLAETAVGIGTPKNDRTPLGWTDWWSRARICEMRQDTAGAIGWLTLARDDDRFCRAVRNGDGAQAALRFIHDAIRVIKRGGDWSLLESWILLGIAGYPDDRPLQVEAAKLYEHRLGKLGTAAVHARNACDEHRLRRLQRKMQA